MSILAPSSLLCGRQAPELQRDELLQDLFVATAQALPQAPALRDGLRSLSYGELLRRGNQRAAQLHHRGVKAGDAVVLWMPRQLEMYEWMLGILLSGAVYVPLDPGFPIDRVAFVARDCRAAAVLTTQVHLDGAKSAHSEDSESAPYWPSESFPSVDGMAGTAVMETGRSPQDCAYILYTSGSTGRPKGVMISHASIAHLVRSEGAVLGLRSSDLVFQGFSLSFDMSLEEIWPAWAAGACLYFGSKEWISSGPDLAHRLSEAGISVWTTVPTLLAMQEERIPSLRLLNLGGEACPIELVRRWARAGLRILNTYGPTETTVTATYRELHPDESVTIGKPLPNYRALIIDERSQALPDGQTGELCIAGPGLALGYLGRPELTAERFVEIATGEAQGFSDTQRFYRTGDLARINAEREIEYLGRMDTQVKIRGYRIELGEIEQALLESFSLRNAVVQPWQDETGQTLLIAYLVPAPEGRMEWTTMRDILRKRLPGYMIPDQAEWLADLPTLPSGKTDRKRLPAPHRGKSQEGKITHPAEGRSAEETLLLNCCRELFNQDEISADMDFFLDLGGHSLRAAALVSRLRREPSFTGISMLDVYQHPKLGELAALIKERAEARMKAPAAQASSTGDAPKKIIVGSGDTAAAQARQEAADKPSHQALRHSVCALAQGISLIGIYSVFSLQWLIPYLSYAWLSSLHVGHLQAMMVALGSFILAIPLMLVTGITAKWVILGRLKSGRYPLWGLQYFRLWLAQRILQTVPLEFLGGTPFLPLYYRLLGMRIGRNVHLSDDTLHTPDCISIGEGTSFAPGAEVCSSFVEGDWLYIREVSIGAHCSVGVSSHIGPGSQVPDDVEIGDLTLITARHRLRSGERWAGSPARKIEGKMEASTVETSERARCSIAGTHWYHWPLYGSILFLFPILAILPFMPGLLWMSYFGRIHTHHDWLFYSPLLALAFVFLMGLEIVVLKWLLIGRVTEARIPLHGPAYLRHWMVDKLMELSLDVMGPLYATVFLRPWYRLLGVKVGPGAEISTASSIGFDLLDVGEGAFVADAVFLGSPRIRDGHLELRRTQIGKRAFVGNSAVIPAGTVLGDDVLIGVLSAPPTCPAEAAERDSSWFGTPALRLPRRARTQEFGMETTFKPGFSLKLQRFMIEGVRVLLPLSCTVALTSLMMNAVVQLHHNQDWSLQAICAVFPFLYLGYALSAGLIVFILKWLVVGRYRPVERPLWSHFVWRSELVTSTYENLAVPFFLAPLVGTPFLPAYLRLLGARIGKRVYMETTDITEFDQVEIGDGASLNGGSGPQTHLFEDRVMKVSTVRMEAGCSLGNGGIVLYDATLEPEARLEALSLVMKGERIPRATRWEGSPAQRQS